MREDAQAPSGEYIKHLCLIITSMINISFIMFLQKALEYRSISFHLLLFTTVCKFPLGFDWEMVTSP